MESSKKMQNLAAYMNLTAQLAQVAPTLGAGEVAAAAQDANFATTFATCDDDQFRALIVEAAEEVLAHCEAMLEMTQQVHADVQDQHSKVKEAVNAFLENIH